MKYEILVDGQRKVRVESDEEVRDWIREYRFAHIETDKDAVHVQVRRLTRWSWLTGGELVPRDGFLD